MLSSVQFWESLYFFFMLLGVLGICLILIEGFSIIKRKLFTRIIYFRVIRRIKRNPELGISEKTIRLVALEEIEKIKDWC